MYIGKARYQKSGFTLIEVLVAMVIFALVMTLSVTSYRFSLLNLTKDDKQKNISELTHIKLINKQIRSLQPFFYPLQNGEKVPFFYGTEDGFSFITDNPIQIASPLAIAKIVVVQNEMHYCEVAFGSIDLTKFSTRDLQCQQSILYLSGNDIKLSYFGWKDRLDLDNFYSEFLNINIRPEPLWYSQFLAEKRKLIPLFVQINVKNSSSIFLELPEITPFQQGASSVFEG